MLALFTAQASNATGTAVKTTHTQTTLALLSVYGTFGGGTVTVQYSPDGGTTYVNFPTPVSITAAGSVQITLPAGVTLQATLAGAAGPSINCRVDY